MIQFETAHIHEFRGIRDLSIKFGRKSFAVCGPNGTGKSGIVDALEFALTGNISRLAGRGTGELSIREHGPHVDFRDNPGEAYVEVEVFIPSLNKKATIHRSVKNARAPKISSSDSEVALILKQIEKHPEFVLSRRELIRYILSEPGKRAEEVQSLLQLNELEVVRKNLQKVANACEKECTPLKSAKTVAAQQLSATLKITDLTGTNLLEAVNARRAILQLSPLIAVDKATSIKEGVSSVPGSGVSSQLPKIQALEDLRIFREKFSALNTEGFKTTHSHLVTQISDLSKHSTTLDALSKETLLQAALKVFDDEHCPVCETEWEPDAFRTIIERKLAYLRDISEKRIIAETELTNVRGAISQLRLAIPPLIKYAKMLKPVIETKPLSDFADTLGDIINQLTSFLPLDKTLAGLATIATIPPTLTTLVDTIQAEIIKLPEATEQDAAKEFLIAGQERLEVYRDASKRYKDGEARASISKTVCEVYGNTVTTKLEKIYQDVEKLFRELYRAINQDDESGFDAKLTPSVGRLGFDVDFYGRGYFPPGAYHSEGHQDGMGVCLYLALMRHILGAGFTFAILDDVLMSVDRAHRREICKLLKVVFPETQFIMTTHDEIWLRHMRTAGLIEGQNSMHFRTWSVDTGPTEWDDRDIWKEMDDHLTSGKIRDAAALLRHYLEYFSKEICHSIRAKVVFKGTLGDLLPEATKRMKDLIKDGKASAKFWKKEDVLSQLGVLETEFSSIVGKCNIEQWQINSAVHYNEWENLDKNDFADVISNYKTLTTFFICNSCHSIIYVMPEYGEKEALRCPCGGTNINLVNKA
jgi:energy-coupling factor transporter ATP-binding protein EcfA2